MMAARDSLQRPQGPIDLMSWTSKLIGDSLATVVGFRIQVGARASSRAVELRPTAGQLLHIAIL